MSLDPHYGMRGRLIDEVIRDATGPNAWEEPRANEEVLNEDPITRYQVAVLYPLTGDTLASVEDNEQGDDDGARGGDDTTEDEPVALANVRYPSSMGITFAIGPDVGRLVIEVTAVRYEPIEAETEQEDRSRRRRKRTWRRFPVVAEPFDLDLVRKPVDRAQLVPGLKLFWRIRPGGADGSRSVTLGLINDNRVPKGQFERDAYTWFAPTLAVRTLDRQDGFVARPSSRVAGINDEDLASYRLLYRHALEFATGHGCSADWDISANDPGRATRIWATFTPRYEVQLADSNPDIRSEWFSLQALARGPRRDVLAGLRSFVGEYQHWIGDCRAQPDGLDQALAATARAHLERCDESARRMLGGIDLLERHDDAWQAFTTMNQAMLEQRARTDWFKMADRSGGPNLDGPHAWRPFQLAFILQSLGGIVDADGGDREIVDLLWFPTGGGKTEAYLGLIGFTIVLRRLRGRGAGVTALMRYTLRLLTIQQFERAATLICALEVIRRRDPQRLGRSEIAIGLWVGGDATPNRRTDAKQALDKIRRGIQIEKGNPIQLHHCPWCGEPLDHSNYWVAQKDPRLVIQCKQDGCDFANGLVAWIVDEDVYRRRPSLLIGTVDKFASLPWRDDARHIFNLGSGEPPPELIIQDELHLISGPLGTLTGLYETAVDALCSDAGVRPKVVASTATIRRAHEQVKALFAREVRQFPAPGVDARDNWFSVEAPPKHKGTRLYLGLMAPGTSQTTLLVRAYAALLQFAAQLKCDEQVRDAYWTLLGYFNSLRVLGGARMQVNDDVPDRMEVLASRAEATTREADRVIELTSREASSEIPGHLRAMACSYPDSHRLDAILATNMISVGVDIDRLSLMAVMGQPQSAAEYIQATSRVGRRWPGLIVVLFNAARSRDRSHYESFRAFHSALYRQVESSSVTPYSPRAIDRALHAVLVGLARLLLPPYGGNDGAAAIRDHRDQLERVFAVVRARARAVEPEQADAVEGEMERIVEQWATVAEDEEAIVYASPYRPGAALLVDASDHESDPDTHFPTLWSLRDVDTESNLYLVRE